MGSGDYQDTIVPLIGDSVTVGRDLGCDVVINNLKLVEEGNFGLENVSRVQFELFKDSSGVSLNDKSMNGTYVNRFRVGNNRFYRIGHEDLIGFINSDSRVFQYLDEVQLRSMFPIAINEKFIIRRVVWEGRFSFVREGFNRLTYSRVAMKFMG